MAIEFIVLPLLTKALYKFGFFEGIVRSDKTNNLSDNLYDLLQGIS